MRRVGLRLCALVFGLVLVSAAPATAQVKYGPWEKTAEGNFFRRCTFPAGGHQYLILVKDNPQWVFWFNPETQVFWCACPTVRHPEFAKDVKEGKDQFLMAIKKSNALSKVEFPPEPGKNFKPNATAKDRNGKSVDLSCPPIDLPPGI